MGYDRYFGFDLDERKTLERLLGEAGPVTPVANVTNVATADGSDAATTQALANANKAKINQILVALRNAGILVT